MFTVGWTVIINGSAMCNGQCRYRHNDHRQVEYLDGWLTVLLHFGNFMRRNVCLAVFVFIFTAFTLFPGFAAHITNIVGMRFKIHRCQLAHAIMRVHREPTGERDIQES
jgi:hypothetical protein